MPEICEVVFTAQYLLTKLKNRLINTVKVISGKYMRENLPGLDLIQKYEPLRITNVDSKGKLLWFELESTKNNHKIYITSTFGLTGHWGFLNDKNARIEISITNDKEKYKSQNINKTYKLYYVDPRNFGNLIITDDAKIFNKKINSLAPDFLKTPFSENDFLETIKKYISKNKKNTEVNITELLMTQDAKKGIGSGLGNYLVPEILFLAKISPLRKLGSLSNIEIKTIGNSIKRIVKLCYVDNRVGYMEIFGDLVAKHKEKIMSGKYPDYHPDIKIKKGETFNFNVYRQKKDPSGNPINISKIIGNRSTYWSPIQK